MVLESHMATPQTNVRSISRSFKALADPTRQRILLLLQERERSVGELVDEFDVSQPAISKHLSILNNAGLVNDHRRGKQVFYSLNVKGVVTCLASCFSQFECCAPYFDHMSEEPG